MFSKSKPLTAYADADYASDDDDRKSISGFLFKVFFRIHFLVVCYSNEAIWLKGISSEVKTGYAPGHIVIWVVSSFYRLVKLTCTDRQNEGLIFSKKTWIPS